MSHLVLLSHIVSIYFKIRQSGFYLKKDNFLPFQFHGFCDEFEMFKLYTSS